MYMHYEHVSIKPTYRVYHLSSKIKEVGVKMLAIPYAPSILLAYSNNHPYICICVLLIVS